jgi:Prp8 binding protein
LKKYKHSSIVNSCSITKRGTELISTASDDGYLKIYDLRQKNPIKNLHTGLPVLATSFNMDGTICFSAGIENNIKAWDLRKEQVCFELNGHLDSITGLSLSPDGTQLLSYSMDNTCILNSHLFIVRSWDIKPFSNQRALKTFQGAPHGFEKNLLRPCWSPESDFVAVGSGDRSVVIWNALNGKMAYKLPGHKGCVNQVDWSGNIVASCGSDAQIYLGELNLNEVK